MDKKSDKSSRELVVYFALALMFALLSIPAGKMITVTYLQSVGSVKLDLRWIFWLSITLSILCILPLLRAKRGLEEEARHANDAVHGRANLVAHVGQEVRLEIR